MKTLLQNPVTHLFFKNLEEWTLDPNQARDFNELSKAIRFQIEHHLHDLQVFLKLERGDLEAADRQLAAMHV
jgi:hypothetical protein